MKKIVAGLICVLIITIFFAGCAASTKDPTAAQQSDDPVVAAQSMAATDSKPTGKVISGEITEIVGNEVTLKLIEMPQRDPSASPRPQGQQNQDPQATPDPKGSAAPQGTSAPQGSSVPQGTQTEDTNGNPGANRVVKYTGETADIIIPVGMKIMQNPFGGMGNRPSGQSGATNQNSGQNDVNQPRNTRMPNAVAAETEVQLSALKKGWTMTITYSKDGTTIEKITVRQPKTGGSSSASSN